MRLLNAIHELVEIQKQQTQAVIDGEPDFARFDILLHMARESKEAAKYDPRNIPDFEQVTNCLRDADRNLGKARQS